MKTSNSLRLCVSLFLVCIAADAEPRRAWVKNYENEASGKSVEPFSLNMDSKGNAIIVGTAYNAGDQAEYLALKYSPGGDLLWSRKYGQQNGTNNFPRSVALDVDDNLYITGTSRTVKYSASGEARWVVPYAGRGIAVQGTNVYVTGVLDGYMSTVCMDAGQGTNRWLQTFRVVDPGGAKAPDYSGDVMVGPDGTVYVVGATVNMYFGHRPDYYLSQTILRYSPSGALVNSYIKSFKDGGVVTSIYDFKHLFLDKSLLITCRYDYGYFITKLNYDLSISSNYELPSNSTLFGKLQKIDKVVFAGYGYQPDSISRYSYLYSINNLNGLNRGVGIYSQKNINDSFSDIYYALPGVVYMSGNLFSARRFVDVYVYQLNENGDVIWSDQYNTSSTSDDYTKSIYGDTHGNFYVLGFSKTGSDASKIILLKYTQTAIEKTANANPQLQFPGEPGKNLKVEATPTLNMPDWTQIALGQVPTNGLFQLEDTNAHQFPARFYRAVTTP